MSKRNLLTLVLIVLLVAAGVFGVVRSVELNSARSDLIFTTAERDELQKNYDAALSDADSVAAATLTKEENLTSQLNTALADLETEKSERQKDTDAATLQIGTLTDEKKLAEDKVTELEGALADAQTALTALQDAGAGYETELKALKDAGDANEAALEAANDRAQAAEDALKLAEEAQEATQKDLDIVGRLYAELYGRTTYEGYEGEEVDQSEMSEATSEWLKGLMADIDAAGKKATKSKKN